MAAGLLLDALERDPSALERRRVCLPPHPPFFLLYMAPHDVAMG